MRIPAKIRPPKQMTAPAKIAKVFSEAVDQDYLAKDPARKVKMPAHLRETDKTVLTWDQLRSALAYLELRDRIISNST